MLFHPMVDEFEFGPGEKVRIRGGSFVGMIGLIKEVISPKSYKDALWLKLEIEIYGRPVIVEAEAWQVEVA
jgi:transcription antitermination factor NusG